MRLWQSKPIWLNSDSFLPNNNVNPSISYYIYKVAFLSTKPKTAPLRGIRGWRRERERAVCVRAKLQKQTSQTEQRITAVHRGAPPKARIPLSPPELFNLREEIYEQKEAEPYPGDRLYGDPACRRRGVFYPGSRSGTGHRQQDNF